jgi:transcriptional regulator with XRE-family HTH domain
MMAIVGHWEEAEAAGEAAREPRRKLRLEARGALPSGAATEILLHDISATGLLLESQAPLMVDERISIDLPQAGITWARVVWTSGKLFGCQFHTPISAAALSAAQLRSAVGQPVEVAPRAAPSPAAALDVSFGARLQRLRREAGISQSHVATALGVSKPTVWAWEHGKARPVGSRMADLASVLGVERSVLLAQAGVPETEDVVARSRAQIAAAFGTNPDKVKIWVEL